MGRKYDQIKKYIEADVEDDVRLLISDFAILWNNYEKYLFPDDKGNPYYKFSKILNNEKGKLSVINKVLNNINDDYEKDIIGLYDRFIIYFKKTDGELTTRQFIERYSVRKSDISYNELSKIIEFPNLKNKYLLLMLMVGRVRNNMFHGIKNINDLNNQKELFEICNNLLTLSLDITNMLVL
ncbi:MAG: hypothetical protein VZS44_05685 [Bacilli bacterium]|nr:hypothetical protein [Bacilli bacterium]